MNTAASRTRCGYAKAYRGPLRWGGTPRAVRLDVTREEKLILPAALRPLLHIYSDADALGQIELACYPLEEILAEKIRAVGGQRRFAISRDLYDIHELVRQGVSVDQAVPLLPAKFAARGIDLKAIRVDQLLGRRAEFEQDWQHRLNYLVPDTGAVTFADAWQSTMEVVRRVETGVVG